MTKIKTTWTYRHLSTLIIVGLVVGITAHVQDFTSHFTNLTKTNAVTYTKTTEQKDCFTACQVEKKTIRIFKENYNTHMESARHEAIAELSRENEIELQKLLFNSPYYDYEAMKEKYGY